MSGYTWVKIDSPADYDQLLSLLAPEFAPGEVVTQLRNAIRATVRGVLIEFEYIDKDYRSTYYRFYAKKGRGYSNDCVWLHFFDAEIGFN